MATPDRRRRRKRDPADEDGSPRGLLDAMEDLEEERRRRKRDDEDEDDEDLDLDRVW